MKVFIEMTIKNENDKSIKDLLEETPEPKMRKVEEGLLPFREPTKEELEV